MPWRVLDEAHVTREQQDELLHDVRVNRHDAAALLVFIEACRMKHELRRRALRMPEPEPEVDGDTTLYV